MRTLVRTLSGIATALVLTLALHPGSVQAQEQSQQSQQECTAQLNPTEVALGQPAVRIQAQLSGDVGAVSSLGTPENSGLALASPEDFAKEKMAREEGEQPEPIQMADQGNRAMVWLSTVGAQAGQHEVVLKGESGRCTAQLTVEDGSSS